MPVSLLATKFFIPPTRADFVARPRLSEKLLAGVKRPGCFTLLSGPAGSGKTTLLSEFVAQLGQPVAWLSLDEGDNDAIRFWSYLITACQSVLDGVGESALALFGTPQALPDDTVPTILINDLSMQDRSIVLVLDDYHVIQNPSIHASLLFLLDHLPHNLHILVSTRVDPPWPLARFRVRNQLLEIRARDLRFSVEEATEFLNHTMGLNLSVENVAALEKRTEGWIAGLQLASIAMQALISAQGRKDVSGFIQAFTGSHVYVAEYLVEEILSRQSEEMQVFLLKTSPLARMNAGLCEAVTDCQDGQALLSALHQANIFLVPLDDKRQWFRYHHLFADLLRARLARAVPADEIAALHQRAADWYECNGFTIEAVNHALAAKDFEKAADLVKQAAHALIFSGRVSVLRDWLESLPKTSFDAHPQLTFYLFWIDVLQSEADLSEHAIQEMEALLRALPSSPENDRLRGELMAVVSRAIALSGRISEGIHLAQKALAYLPAEDLASRARANSALAIAYDLEGQAEKAGPVYKVCFSQAVAGGDYRLAAHTMMVKGLIQCDYGQLHEATRTFQALINMGDRAEAALADKVQAAPTKSARTRQMFFPAGQGYIGLGIVHLEWYDLETAEKYLEQGMELCRRGGLDGIFIAQMQISRLRQAKGDLKGALEGIRLPERASQRVDDFNVATRQVRIALAKGDIDNAWRWAAPLSGMLKRDSTAIQPPMLFFERIAAIVARVYLAQGEIEKTLSVLDDLQATAEPGKRLARLIEVHLLRALVYQKQNRGTVTPEASESFLRALVLGEQAGYVLLFLEEGSAVIPLLNAVVKRQPPGNSDITPEGVKQYARKLLEVFGEEVEMEAALPPREAVGLVEPLTPRELEVLALLAAGDSNQAIADKLFITVRTVKKHTSNIYGKLDVSSRTQAVARARELGLPP
jgi:LuxR family maltose regulon positive regulatory protein